MEEKAIKAESAGAPKKKLKRQFFLSVFVIALVMMLLGDVLGELLLDLVAKQAAIEDGGVLFLFQYLSFIGIVAVILLYCALAEKKVLRSFAAAGAGGMAGNTVKRFLIGLLLGFGMNGACILVAWLHGDLDFSVGRFEAVYLLCALLVVLIQSGAEELLTRGYMLGALRQRYPVWVAVAVNSLFFASAHLLNPGITVSSVLDIFLTGLVLSLVVYYFDSLWLCIGLHTAWNFNQNFLFGLPNSGIVSERSFLHLEGAAGSVFYDPVFGVEGALPALAVTVIVGVAVVLLAKRKPGAAA